MMRTTKEQLTMVSVVAASKLPSRTIGKATKESHSSFQVVSNNSTGSSVTGYRSPSSASSDMAVKRHSVTPLYSGFIQRHRVRRGQEGPFHQGEPGTHQQVPGAHGVQPSQGQNLCPAAPGGRERTGRAGLDDM